MARGISFAFLIVVAAAACTACVGEDPNSVPTTPASDGGSSGGPANTGLVENGGFENGCDTLFTSNGALTSDSTAKTGAKSCKLCRTPGGEPSLYLYARLGKVNPKVGDTYDVSAWMRKAPGSESGGNSQIAIASLDSTGSPTGDGTTGNGPDAITDEWKEAKLSWTVAKADGQIARVDIGLPSAADNVCILIDDLTVTRR